MQSALVIFIVAAATTYVARSFFPRKRPTAGCTSCPANPNRRGDYV